MSIRKLVTRIWIVHMLFRLSMVLFVVFLLAGVFLFFYLRIPEAAVYLTGKLKKELSG